jgi:hypothetical protein
VVRCSASRLAGSTLLALIVFTVQPARRNGQLLPAALEAGSSTETVAEAGAMAVTVTSAPPPSRTVVATGSADAALPDRDNRSTLLMW